MPCWLSSRATDLTLEDKYPEDYLDKAKWENDRTIRATLIRWLLVNPDALKFVDPKGIWIIGARIIGPLDLNFVNVSRPLVLRWSSIAGALDLAYATVQRLDLEHSYVDSIEATNLVVNGDALLRMGFQSGAVGLEGASIHGSLDFYLGRVSNPGFTALSLDGVDVLGYLDLSEFNACGLVYLQTAKIHGYVELSGGSFDASPNCGKESSRRLGSINRDRFDEPNQGAAIIAEGIEVGGGIFSDSDTSVAGYFNLHGSNVTGEFWLRGIYTKTANLNYPYVIDASDSNLNNTVTLDLTANGSINLTNSEIGDDLIIQNANIKGPGVLTFSSLNVKHRLKLLAYNPLIGKVDLSDSKTAVFWYGPAPVWPNPGTIDLDGFIHVPAFAI